MTTNRLPQETPATTARTLIIIPAFNEEESIGGVVESIRINAPEYDVLVVDDGSRDKTARVARSAGAIVMQLPFNLGVGGAVRAGLKHARRHGYERAIQVDADGQHDTDHIRVLLSALDNGTQLAVGSRFVPGSGEYGVGGVRRSAMRLLSRMVSSLLGFRIHDTTSGFRAFGSEAIDLLADRYPRDYLSDTVETLLLVGYNGLPIVEQPVQMHERAGGLPSARSFRLVYHYIRMLVVIGATLSLSARRRQRTLERAR